MAKKCIILLRVSTDRQEIKSQKADLKLLAKADGYTKDEMIFIEGVGASAIKLNKKYLQEIEDLKRTITTTPDILAVYCWEISRLGRNEKILFEIKDFLIKRKINLIIYQPSLRLLNHDGSVNNGVELAFSLFATLSKQEMEVKKERMLRGKRMAQECGKWDGGTIVFGYATDAKNNIIPHKTNAATVGLIFEWYVNHGMTTSQIYNKLVDEQRIERLKVDRECNRISKICKILNNPTYIGIPKVHTKYGIKTTSKNHYPPIISKELFVAAQNILKTKRVHYNTPTIYFGKGLLRHGGYMLRGVKDRLVYSTVEGRFNINLNAVDTAIWNEAVTAYGIYTAQADTKKKQVLKKQLKDLETQIKARLRDIKKQDDKMSKLEDMYIEGMPKERFIAKKREIERDATKYQKELERLKIAYNELNAVTVGQSSKRPFERLREIKKIKDDKTRKEIIDTVIERVEAYPFEDGKRIDITVKSNSPFSMQMDHYYLVKSRGNKVELFCHYIGDWVAAIPIEHRLKRNKK